jgi:hypothetical protein
MKGKDIEMNMYNFRVDGDSLRANLKETIITCNPLFLEIGFNIANLDYILSLIDDKLVLSDLIRLFEYRFDKLEVPNKRTVTNMYKYLYNGNLVSNSDVPDDFMDSLFRTASDVDRVYVETLLKFVSNENERVKNVKY